MTISHGSGSIVPHDFPRPVYNEVFKRILTAADKVGSPLGYDFHDSWLAVAYRFATCAEHDSAFQASIQQFGSNVPQREQYIQERELFGFFVSGLASIESCYYSCYVLAAMLNSANFPMTNPKSINPSTTADKFVKFHHHEALATQLDHLRKMTEYQDWSDIRNVLAHRIIPPRQVSVQLWPPQPNPTHNVTWMGGKIPLDMNTTTLRRIWLATVLGDLVAAVDIFTAKHFS